MWLLQNASTVYLESVEQMSLKLKKLLESSISLKSTGVNTNVFSLFLLSLTKLSALMMMLSLLEAVLYKGSGFFWYFSQYLMAANLSF